MPSLEVSKRKAILALLKKRGAWYVITTGVSKAGTPDVLACYRGYFIALEVKREHDGKYGVTPKQELELQLIKVAGGYSLVAVEVDEVSALLDHIDATR